MTLGEKRRQFSLDLAILIVWANREGYAIAIDDVKAHDGHMVNSKHYEGLAADLNLYLYDDELKKWIYERGITGHDVIGKEWKRMGHVWGGDFSNVKDYNHYQY